MNTHQANRKCCMSFGRMTTPHRLGHPARLSESAIMLVECVVYIGLWMVITGLAFTAFYRYWDHSRDLQRNADDIVRAIKAGERWRADLRTATIAPSLETTDYEQVLHIPQKTGEILYLFSRGEVWRLATGRAIGQPLLAKVKGSRMLPENRTRTTVWCWELELQTRQKNPRIRPLFTFLTVCRQGGNAFHSVSLIE
ncbi:MAG: hypothetical protein M1608_18370 [Candidatus Omnitrophica bacterium]|nr:hypothetical protein [Candidatus Omnitrophota bacterium]